MLSTFLSEEVGQNNLEKQTKQLEEKTALLAIDSPEKPSTDNESEMDESDMSDISTFSYSNVKSGSSSACPSPRIIPPEPDSKNDSVSVPQIFINIYKHTKDCTFKSYRKYYAK